MSPVRQHQLLGLGLGVVDIGIDLKALHHVLDQRILPFTSVKASMDPDLFGNLCIIDTPTLNSSSPRRSMQSRCTSAEQS
jgi:hypothetical protein